MPLRVAFPPLSTRPAPGLSSQAGCRLTANELHCQVTGTVSLATDLQPKLRHIRSYAHIIIALSIAFLCIIASYY